MAELIPTGYTYDQGRIAINGAFSGSGTFIAISTISLTGGTISGGTYYSGSTPLYNIIQSASTVLWSASTGANSIIANNGTGNKSYGANSIALGTFCLASGTSSFAGGYATDSASGIEANGLGAFNYSSTNGGGFPTFAGGDYSAILGGVNNRIIYSASNSVILGMDSFIAYDANTTHVKNMYIDGYKDMQSQGSVPTAKAGRMYFSGGTLNRLILFTGNTAADYMILS